jgi:hypothetical protein
MHLIRIYFCMPRIPVDLLVIQTLINNIIIVALMNKGGSRLNNNTVYMQFTRSHTSETFSFSVSPFVSPCACGFRGREHGT